MLRILSWALVGLAASWAAPASYGQFCGGCFGGVPATFSESVHEARVVYLVRWISKSHTEEDGDFGAESTTFEILDVLKPGRPSLEPRSGFVLDFHVEGERGDLFLLFGTREEDLAVLDGETGDKDAETVEQEIDWNTSEPISEAAYAYLRNAPPSADVCGDAVSTDRLKYFLKFLDHPDETIADDAFAEFDKVPWNELGRIADHFPKIRLRAWLRSDETPAHHKELFGLMLGLCGATADAKLLEGLLLERDDDDEFWFDRRGLQVGYLLLTGERGISFLDEAVFRNGQIYDCESVLAAISSLQESFPEAIEPNRLRRSIHLLLNRPEMAGTAIEMLAHMSDWDAQPDILRLYGSCGYEDSSVKLSIISYLRASADTNADGQLSAHAAAAKQFLDALEEKDPAILKEFEQHFGELDLNGASETVP